MEAVVGIFTISQMWSRCSYYGTAKQCSDHLHSEAYTEYMWHMNGIHCILENLSIIAAYNIRDSVIGIG
jgi:hypothetical protein